MAKKQIKFVKTNAMRLLETLGIDYAHYEYECNEFVDSTHTSEALGIAPERMFKTLVTQGVPKQYYVFVIPIMAELDLKKAAAEVHEKSLSMIPTKDLTAITGYVRGGCTALGMKKKFPTIIDGSAQSLEKLVVSAGRLGCQIELSPCDFLRATEGKFADVIVSL